MRCVCYRRERGDEPFPSLRDYSNSTSPLSIWKRLIQYQKAIVANSMNRLPNETPDVNNPVRDRISSYDIVLVCPIPTIQGAPNKELGECLAAEVRLRVSPHFPWFVIRIAAHA